MISKKRAIWALMTTIGTVAGIFLFSVSKDEEPDRYQTEEPVLLALESPAAVKRAQRLDRFENYKKKLHQLQQISAVRQREVDQTDSTEIDRYYQSTTRMALLLQGIDDAFFDTMPAAYDELMNEQPEDVMWTGMVKNVIESNIAESNLDGTELTSTSCHHTICKLTFSHEDEDAMRMMAQYGFGEGMAGLFTPAQGFHTTADDGSIDSIIYLGKPDNLRNTKIAALERSYEIVTGDSADNVVPTDKQIEQVKAQMQ